jgi:hypothetical protein
MFSTCHNQTQNHLKELHQFSIVKEALSNLKELVMKNVLGACALFVTIYTFPMLPMCQTYQQKLITANQALTHNTPETSKTDWIIATFKTMQATIINCLNMHGIPATLLGDLPKLSAQDKQFNQAFQLALINYSIYLAILEAHPLVKLFCSPVTQTCTYPGTLKLNENYFTKKQFQNLIQRLLRLLPSAGVIQKTAPGKTVEPLSKSSPCPHTCDTLKAHLAFISDAPLIEQLQTLENSLNSCIDFYQCAPTGCSQASMLTDISSLTTQETNTMLTNCEIRLALLETQPMINLFCPTQTSCDLAGFTTTLDTQQRITRLAQRMIRIWPFARAQFPATCPQEQPDIERHDLDKKEQEADSGDGDDADEEKNDDSKTERDIPPILK